VINSVIIVSGGEYWLDFPIRKMARWEELFDGDGIGPIDVRVAEFGTESKKGLSSQTGCTARNDNTHRR
jgi:hypothetical protein